MERFVFADEHNCDRTYVLYADAQAQIEALQRERDHAKKMEAVQKEVADNQTWHVRELRTALDAEREKVTQVSLDLQAAWRREADLQAQLSQLQALVRAKEAAYEKILLSRERLEREVRGYPPVDNEGIPMVWEEPVGWVKRTLDATTPAPDTSIIGKCAPPAQWNQNAQVRGDVG